MRGDASQQVRRHILVQANRQIIRKGADLFDDP
jgi:hypothetical protein